MDLLSDDNKIVKDVGKEGEKRKCKRSKKVNGDEEKQER